MPVVEISDPAASLATNALRRKGAMLRIPERGALLRAAMLALACVCGQAVVAHADITGLAPAEGSLGTEITITGTGFGTKKPKVRLVEPGSRGRPLQVLAYRDDQIVARVVSGAAGDYDLLVQTRSRPRSEFSHRGFRIRLPSDVTISPRVASPGALMTGRASFLGAKKGRIRLNGKRVKTASWNPIDGTFSFVLPAKLPSGVYDLGISNGVGFMAQPGALVVAADPESENSKTGKSEAADEQRLKVVSAVAASNTEVLVQFSKPLNPIQAEDPSNYRITAASSETAAASAAYVRIVAAEVLAPSFLTVRLTTLSQSELVYLLKATNLIDLAGMSIAPAEGEDAVIDPSATRFVGMPPSGSLLVDSDGDGLSDADEQRGWLVQVWKGAEESDRFYVTSDPEREDTDGDGVTDPEEKHGRTDPRSPDTDGDTLSDDDEWNVIYSDPANEDTDLDGTQDGFEFYSYRTSPVLADTDGDQIIDTDEVLGRNRDPRIADIPRAGIRVGEVRLLIDERFTFEDSQGTTQTIESSSSSSLSQSENTTFATSNTAVTEHVAGAKLTSGIEGGDGGRGDAKLGGKFFNIEGSYQYTNSNSFTSDRTSAVESQRVHEQSLNKTREISTTSTVTREVFGARIDVDLTIENAGDLAFAISNLEITVLQRDRQSTNRFVPVATLIPNSTLITGEPAVFNLGPFTPERGPIVFSSRDVFPSLVEELMKSPSGLIFKVANFDMTDEFGRVFTFANQIARDRTAGIIVDFGDGEEHQNLVATALQPDREGFAGAKDAFVGGFDDDGSPTGIPLDFALQDTLELTKNATTVDGIVAGPNRKAETRAQGDDVQEIPEGTTGVGVGSVVVSAGQNGILESSPGPQGDDEEVVTTGYETSLTCDAASENAGETCSADGDCTGGGTCAGPEILVRFGSYRNGDFDRVWVVLTNRNIPAGADFGQVILEPGADIFLAFVQDLDEDGLFAREEYMSGSTDSRADLFDNALFGESFDESAPASLTPDDRPDSEDTDRDGIGDFAEVRLGWKVSADGGTLRQVFSSPRLRDSDGDGLLDPVERDLRRFCAPGDGRGDGLCAFQSALVPIDDAVAIIAGPNGVADSLAVPEDEQKIPQGTIGLGYATPVVGVGNVAGIQSPLLPDDRYESLTGVPPATDPSVGDTDLDTVSDFEELTGFDIGLSIRDGGNGVADTRANGDDLQRAFLGNPVKRFGIVILPGPNGGIDSTPGGDDTRPPIETVVTDPLRRDTDGDLVADGRERDQGGNPRNALDGQEFRDSDQDGLTDSEEADLGWLLVVNGVSAGIVKSNPSLPDSDLDGLPDLIERDIRSNPNDPDTDGDGLRDFDEFADFERFFGLEQLYPRFSVNGSTSKQYGTDPTHRDSDQDSSGIRVGDTLSDFEELITGYKILLAGEQAFRQIFTDPLLVDSDFDGLADNEERNRWPSPTDATDPDTDDDGRTDSQEVTANTDPLVPDIRVTVTYAELKLNGGPNPFDATWEFSVGLNTEFPGVAVSTQDDFDGTVACGGGTKLGVGNLTRFPLTNASRSIPLTPGQGVSINTVVTEVATCSGEVTRGDCYAFTCIAGSDVGDACFDDGDCGDFVSSNTLSCDMSDLDFLSYDDLTANSFTGKEVDLTDGTCKAKVTYFIGTE